MPASTGYDLFLTDAEGRTDRRQIARADTAAMVIESWLQADLSDPLLDRAPPADAPPAPIVAASATAGAAREVSPTVAAVASPAVAPGRVLASLRGERAIDGGGAMWWGVVAGACFRLGPLCVGPEARLRVSEGPPGRRRSARRCGKSACSISCAASRAAWGWRRRWRWGPLRLLPGIFLGAGRLSGRWSGHDDDLERARPRSESPSPIATGPIVGARRRRPRRGTTSDWTPTAPPSRLPELGLRAGAGLGLALPLGRGRDGGTAAGGGRAAGRPRRRRVGAMCRWPPVWSGTSGRAWACGTERCSMKTARPTRGQRRGRSAAHRRAAGARLRRRRRRRPGRAVRSPPRGGLPLPVAPAGRQQRRPGRTGQRDVPERVPLGAVRSVGRRRCAPGSTPSPPTSAATTCAARPAGARS